MINVVKMPSREEPDVEAGLWISKINRGLDKKEEKAFKEWISIEENREEFTFLAQLWDDMEDLSRLSELFPEEGFSEQPVAKRRLAIAASFVIALCTFGFLFKGYLYQPSHIQQYETLVGEQSRINLSDGSVLTLNTDSAIQVEFDDDNRLLTLDRGEIHINVAHDKTRPLSVKVANKVVQAVGTAFNIELLKNNNVEVVVTDGKVRIDDRTLFEKRLRSAEGQTDKKVKTTVSSKSVVLSKGEVASLTQSNIKPVLLKGKNIEAMLSWRNGHLQFNGEPLEQAILEVSRYTAIEFEFESDEIKKVRIAGRFRAGDVNGLLFALEDTFQISARKINNQKFSLYRQL